MIKSSLLIQLNQFIFIYYFGKTKTTTTTTLSSSCSTPHTLHYTHIYIHNIHVVLCFVGSLPHWNQHKIKIQLRRSEEKRTINKPSRAKVHNYRPKNQKVKVNIIEIVLFIQLTKHTSKVYSLLYRIELSLGRNAT